MSGARQGTLTIRFSQSFKGFRSRALVALLLFACADLSFRAYADSGRFDRFEAANHRWTWWQTKVYRELPYTPDVVMFGSSLLTRIVNEGESTYLNRTVNVTKHNRSRHLEDAIQANTGVPIKTYAFNLPGMHASDAAVLVNALLRDKTPSTIIYTIAPRDFLDNLLDAPYATEPFELMSHISDVGELAPNARITKEEKFSFFLQDFYDRLTALGNCKTELATIFQRKWRETSLPVLEAHVPTVEHPLTPGVVGIRTSAFDYPDHLNLPPEDVNKIEHINNFQCYQFCYQPFRPKIYNAQLYYLDYILKFAHERGVNVILVNMPLRKDNLNAMMPNFWEMYKADIKKHAAQYNAQFVDLFDTNEFADKDFCDTVHLTGRGSIKLVDKMANAVSTSVASQTLAHSAGRSSQVAGRSQAH
ncbi:MAG TPA: hypothetical protein V6C76_01545 [Drouetiella sp.]